MFLLILLAIIALFLITFIVLAVGAGGAIFLVIFSDVVVCIGVIIWLIVKIFKH